MNDLAALIDCGISERSNEGVERPESDLESSPLGRLKNPSSIMSACNRARFAALWSTGSDKKLNTRKESISHYTSASPSGSGKGDDGIPIDVMDSLVVNG